MNLSAGIEADLTNAKVRLARLRKQAAAPAASAAGNGGGDSGGSAVCHHDNNVAVELFARAREAEDRVELISLERQVVHLVSSTVARNNNADAAAGVGGENAAADTDNLAKATETCTAIGLILLQHPRNGGRKSAQFLTALAQWYNALHASTRTTALNIFRTHLRKISPEYPSNERSSTLISESLSPANTSSRQEWTVAAKCLVELQVVHDAMSVQNSNWRLDIVDELCKPIAERLRFHFLEEQTGIMTAGGPGGQQVNPMQPSQQQQQQTSKIDRLPEWLFRYLREIVENHEVHSQVIMTGVQPLIDSVLDSLIVRASMAEDDENNGLEEPQFDSKEEQADEFEKKPAEILTQLRREQYDHSSSYFLREMGRMARHVLRAKDFFQHPDVVGSECRDRTVVLRGIEQLFLFDSFLEEKVQGGGGEHYQQGNGTMNRISPPRMVDVFLSSNEYLLRWWLEEERYGIGSSLHRCATSTLSSYLDSSEDEGGNAEKEATKTANIKSAGQQRLYPEVSENFVALLHSARRKSDIFSDWRSRQMYIADVIAPLCSEYLDMIHAEAARLRKQLLARPTSASGVSVLHRSSTNIPSDELLTLNTTQWASLITGTHFSARAVLLQQPQVPDQNNPNNNNVLERVGKSIQGLCEAMIDDFAASAFVETIVMERAKLASYVMRAPFLLSEPPTPRYDESPDGRRGKKDKDKSSISLSLSPDLNDSIHVLSVCLRTCDAIRRKLDGIFHTDNGEGMQNQLVGSSLDNSIRHPSPHSMLYFGSKTIHDSLKFAIGQKLLDIAIDPQGMTPEIYLGGATQFQHDVSILSGLFSRLDNASGNVVVEPGPMERAITASRLMALETSHIQAIREALMALVVPTSSGIGSLFGRRADEVPKGSGDGDGDEYANDDEAFVNQRLNADDFYRDERLMEEAINMLEAKGFGALALDEALSIINRICLT